MYFLSNSGGYSSCNWLNGIPLWHNKGDVYEQGLIPSVQINYEFIKGMMNVDYEDIYEINF